MVKNFSQYTKIFESNQKIMAGTLFNYYAFGNIRKMLLGKKIRVWDQYGIIMPRFENAIVTDVYLGVKILGNRRVVVEINHLDTFDYNDNWTIEIINPKRVFSKQDPFGEEDWSDLNETRYRYWQIQKKK